VLVHALSLVFSGGIYIPPQILGDDASPARPSASRSPVSPTRRDLPAELGLTERQIEVLAQIMQGKSNKVIAHLLDMAGSFAAASDGHGGTLITAATTASDQHAVAAAHAS
jgi:DNA-binding NarL/FixJ family response regulator